jgi:hypothetical protein
LDALAQPAGAGQDLAEDGLGFPVPVDVGMVKERDADVQRRIDGLSRNLNVGDFVGFSRPVPPRPMQP